MKGYTIESTSTGAKISIRPEKYGNGKKQRLTTHCDVILSMALIQFTATHDTTVFLDELEVYERMGYLKYDENGKPTRSSLKHAREYIKEELEALYQCDLEVSIGGQKYPTRILMSYRLEGRIHAIRIDLAHTYTDLLAPNGYGTIMQYPIDIAGLGARRNNAYSIMKKLAEHSTRLSNLDAGNSCLLRVETLLEQTTFVEYLQKKGHGATGWDKAIREQLERQLVQLQKEGYIRKWSYTTPNKFDSLDRWLKAVIRFELADAPDLTEELEQWREKRKESKAADSMDQSRQKNKKTNNKKKKS